MVMVSNFSTEEVVDDNVVFRIAQDIVVTPNLQKVIVNMFSVIEGRESTKYAEIHLLKSGGGVNCAKLHYSSSLFSLNIMCLFLL